MLRVVIVARSLDHGREVAAPLRQGGLHVVSVCEAEADALTAVQVYRPDAVLLDLGLGRERVASVIGRLHDVLSLPVLLLSSLTEDEVPAAIEALCLGAADVIGEPGAYTPAGRRQAPEEIVGAVRMAVRIGHQARNGQRSAKERTPATGHGAALHKTARPWLTVTP